MGNIIFIDGIIFITKKKSKSVMHIFSPATTIIVSWYSYKILQLQL